jgi:hypothetical protein
MSHDTVPVRLLWVCRSKSNLRARREFECKWPIWRRGCFSEGFGVPFPTLAATPALNPCRTTDSLVIKQLRCCWRDQAGTSRLKKRGRLSEPLRHLPISLHLQGGRRPGFRNRAAQGFRLVGQAENTLTLCLTA